jgi:hypothetical protein
MKTLQISLKILNRLVELNRIIRSKSDERAAARTIGDTNFRKLPSTDEIIDYILSPEVVEVTDTINNLSKIEKKELSAIIWIGRGDFDDFDTAFNYAEGLVGPGTGNYLRAKPLYEYIPDGIATIRAKGIAIK